MSIPVAEALAVLHAAADDGRLAELCGRHGVELVVLFGSAVNGEHPNDVDVAVGFEYGVAKDVIGFAHELAKVVPGDHVDILDLNAAGPVARVEALTRGRVLYEARPSVFAQREIAALGEYLDTAYLREALLRELAR